MSFFRGLASKLTGGVGSGAATAPSFASRVTLPAPARMRYTLARNRWHLDARDPVSVILIHDALRSSHAVSPISAAITRMPATGHCPSVPLDVYAPDLRFHGRTAVTAATQPTEADGADAGSLAGSSSMLLANVSDVIRFAAHVVEFQQAVHLVGVGHGARVALAAAVASPDAFLSVTAIDGAADAAATEALIAALRQLPSSAARGDIAGETLASLAAKAQAVIPHEQDRLDILADFEEPSAANGGKAQWRRAASLTEGDAAAVAKSIHAWPEAALGGLKYGGPVLSIGKRFSAGGLPKEVLAHLDADKVSAVQLPADASAAVVLDVFLRTHDLHGEVEQVVNVACGDGY